MNCLECITQAEEGNLSSVKEIQKTCDTYLNNQCNNFAIRDSFDEVVQDTLIDINPNKWSYIRKIFTISSILLFLLSIIISITYKTMDTDKHLDELGITQSILTEIELSDLKLDDFSTFSFLYASRNRHHSLFQKELKDYLYQFLPHAIEVTPSQAYYLEEQKVVLLSGIVTSIQLSDIAETSVWISDGQEADSYSIIWFLNGYQISESFIGREIQLLTVLEESGLGGHLYSREWLIIPKGL